MEIKITHVIDFSPAVIALFKSLGNLEESPEPKQQEKEKRSVKAKKADPLDDAKETSKDDEEDDFKGNGSLDESDGESNSDTDDQDDEPVNLKTIRAKVVELKNAGKTEVARKVFAKYKIKNLKELEATHFPAFYKLLTA